MNPEFMELMKSSILNSMYLIMGIICVYIGIKNIRQKNHASKFSTGIFWICLGIALGLGAWVKKYGDALFPNETYSIGNIFVGAIVIFMTIPAILNKVKPGENRITTSEDAMKQSNKIGLKIFIPTLTIGLTSLIFALFIPSIGAIAGLGIGVLVSSIIILAMSKDKPTELLDEGKRLIETVGPLSMLPMLLASLGAVFTLAGVGEIIAKSVSHIVPQGNIFMGIVLYGIGMTLFTMIMGNAFAAFSVMTIGIGIPFVLEYGLDPNVIGMLGLTCGYCGTLMTPMAANFNIVPVAVLDMKDRNGVIKNQVFIAICMLVIQIILMNVLG